MILPLELVHWWEQWLNVNYDVMTLATVRQCGAWALVMMRVVHRH
ncbi:hypothetical protein [Alkanindiges illinoisensis]|nr:hypothetical protein [Alkanindiges illinoisensis]